MDLMHFNVIIILSPGTRDNVGGGMVSVSTALRHLMNLNQMLRAENGF